MKVCILMTGIHGVGKNYLLDKIEYLIKYNYYDASALIKRMNRESDQSKKVSNVVNNQLILIEAVNNYVVEESYILNGHTVLINKDNQLERIPLDVFKSLNLKSIILVVETPAIIKRRLLERNKYDWSLEFITKFQKEEIAYAKELAEKLNIKLNIVTSETSVLSLVDKINSIDINAHVYKKER